MPPREGVYGLLAEFNTPSELVHATEMAHRAGYRRMECYTPYPVEQAAEALRFHKTRVPLLCLLGGLCGLTTGALLEIWVNVWGYPLNIRAMPLFFFFFDFVCWPLGGVWHDCAEWIAAAVSSAVQCAKLCEWSNDG